MSAAGLISDILLAAGVAIAWLGCLGLVVLGSVYDRIHCLGFVGAASGALFTLAILVAQGATPLGLKSLAAYLLLLATGAVAVHATARALRLRSESREPAP